jgi:hypothetical protein
MSAVSVMTTMRKELPTQSSPVLRLQVDWLRKK